MTGAICGYIHKWGKEGDMIDRVYRCEDCGAVFEEVELDLDEEPLVCPKCEGMDLQLVEEKVSDET